MKDGRTHLAQVVDMETGAVVGVTVQTIEGGDTASLPVTLEEAQRQLAKGGDGTQGGGRRQGLSLEQDDDGCETAKNCAACVSEPDRGRRKLKGKTGGAEGDLRQPSAEPGKAASARRAEMVERAFAHMLETGDMRCLHVRGQDNIRKRIFGHIAAFSLGLVIRKRYGFGTPRALQGLDD